MKRMTLKAGLLTVGRVTMAMNSAALCSRQLHENIVPGQSYGVIADGSLFPGLGRGRDKGGQISSIGGEGDIAVAPLPAGAADMGIAEAQNGSLRGVSGRAMWRRAVRARPRQPIGQVRPHEAIPVSVHTHKGVDFVQNVMVHATYL